MSQVQKTFSNHLIKGFAFDVALMIKLQKENACSIHQSLSTPEAQVVCSTLSNGTSVARTVSQNQLMKVARWRLNTSMAHTYLMKRKNLKYDPSPQEMNEDIVRPELKKNIQSKEQ